LVEHSGFDFNQKGCQKVCRNTFFFRQNKQTPETWSQTSAVACLAQEGVENRFDSTCGGTHFLKFVLF